MVGGRSADVRDERLYRFEFPERPGALLQFLETLGGRWNISLFHYRNHGADFGRVLAGFEVPAVRGGRLPELPASARLSVRARRATIPRTSCSWPATDPDVVAIPGGRRILAVVLLPSAMLAASDAYPPPRFSDRDRVQKLESALPEIDRIFRGYAEEKKIPGMVWGVVIDARLAHVGTFGVRDRSSQDPVHSSTGVPHRLDDQELHGARRAEAARRGQAVARRPGVQVDTAVRPHGAAHARQRAAARPPAHEPQCRLPRGQSVGRSAARAPPTPPSTNGSAAGFRSRRRRRRGTSIRTTRSACWAASSRRPRASPMSATCGSRSWRRCRWTGPPSSSRTSRPRAAPSATG